MKKQRCQKSQRANRRKNKNSTPAEDIVSIEYALAYFDALIDDASAKLHGHYRIADVTKDKAVIQHRLKSEGLSFATKTLPTLITGLLNLLEGYDASFPQFKIKRGTKHPNLFNRLFHLVLESTDERVKVQAFDLLYSLSVAFKKLKGDYSDNVLGKQFADFLKTDEELDMLDFFEESTFPMLELARSYIASWFKDFTLETVRATPQPGPGAVNTPREKTERFRPHVLYKQIDRVFDHQEWWYAHPWDACERSREFTDLHNNAIDEPTARFKFVPKTAAKPRGICIEQNEMQVMQQAMRKYFYRFFSENLHPYIAIDDQSINASLALVSSLSQENATIDMSEGSDRVSRELVSWLFQDNQELHDCLMALSTRWVVPPVELSDVYKDPLRTKKYAPMGSALCFPIMCLVHLALCRAIIEHNAYPVEYTNSVYVYGDDIVVPSSTTEDIYTWLPKFGMKLNKTKSFYRSHFRESCGIHAYYGVDVTPVYLKYSLHHNNANAVASALAIEEQLHTKGFTQSAMIHRILANRLYGITDTVVSGTSEAGFSRPFSEEGLRRFKLIRRRKWNKKLQCYMYVSEKIVKSIVKKKINDDYDAYLRWLWTHAASSGPPGSEFGSWVIGDSFGDLMKVRRMVPESALMEAKIQSIIDGALERYPTSRPALKKVEVVVHKVVLRQSSYLQQLGAAENCCFC